MSTPVVEQIRQRHHERREAIEQLAKRVALGEEIEPDEVEAELSGSEIDLDEFDSLVRSYNRRTEFRATIQAASQRESDLRNVQAEIAAANGQWEQAIAEHRAKTLPMRARFEQLSHAPKPDRQGAITQLIEECPNTALRKKYRSLNSQIESIDRTSRLDNTELATARRRAIGSSRALAEAKNKYVFVGDYEERARSSSEDVARLEQRLEEQGTERDRLQSELDEVRQQLLDY